jgi:LasA protease
MKKFFLIVMVINFLLYSCTPHDSPQLTIQPPTTPIPSGSNPQDNPFSFEPRRPYSPGELVDYNAQDGDTLPALAAHFNSTEKEIRKANPVIPQDATTLPPGFPMKIPIYYMPLWGNPYHIIPDSLFVNGPAQINFDTVAYVVSSEGWFNSYQTVAGGNMSNGGEVVQHVATLYSISPRLLLAILEYNTGALTQPNPPDDIDEYPLGIHDPAQKGIYLQLISVANLLNNGFYGWRTGNLKSFEHIDGKLERPDPWQNASTVALDNYLAKFLPSDEYDVAVTGRGFSRTYSKLFGDPWANEQPHIPGSLQQISLQFPFQPGKIWSYTGGPHTGWGVGEPYAAIDFGPPSLESGCAASVEWATAVTAGNVVRLDTGVVVLDTDGDNDEHTGWVIFYLHLSGLNDLKIGTHFNAGDPIGHPSCEGGEATGTHVHIARKYNGEWIPAGGPLAFNLEGWSVHNGSAPYFGTLEKFTNVITACTCSDKGSQIMSAIPQK